MKPPRCARCGKTAKAHSAVRPSPGACDDFTPPAPLSVRGLNRALGRSDQ